MGDEQQEGLVVLFPENFPDWALSAEERRAKRRLRLIESRVDADELDDDDESV